MKGPTEFWMTILDDNFTRKLIQRIWRNWRSGQKQKQTAFIKKVPAASGTTKDESEKDWSFYKAFDKKKNVFECKTTYLIV